jgi:hypothetical protein
MNLEYILIMFGHIVYEITDRHKPLTAILHAPLLSSLEHEFFQFFLLVVNTELVASNFVHFQTKLFCLDVNLFLKS